jgi:uncharacterized hydrophobic protein (TIGR00271 family)
MLHLRIVVPTEKCDDVLELLLGDPAVTNIIHLPGAAREPRGDVVLCDVAREEGSAVIHELRRRGIDEAGSIAVEDVDASLSRAAVLAEKAATGAPADAVVWEEVASRTSESAELSFSFVAFMVLATMIAAVGILTDSQILIIGAMVVGPEFGPLAGFCVALVQRRLDLARRSLAALLVGFPVAIAGALTLTLVLRGAEVAADELTTVDRPATLFISHPNWFSVVVALLAGVAGTLSLTAAKSGALIGVLISVTTIPAAANVGVALAYGDWHEMRGAAGQLTINLGCIVLAGVGTLALQRYGFARRLAVRRRGINGAR